MDLWKRKVAVHLLIWWLSIVHSLSMLFISICVTVLLYRRLVSNRPRKRRRNGRNAVEMIVDAFKDFAATIERSIQLATEKACTAIDQMAGEANNSLVARAEELYPELVKVQELTEEERIAAYVKICKDDRLLAVFPTIPADAKAAWVQQLLTDT